VNYWITIIIEIIKYSIRPFIFKSKTLMRTITFLILLVISNGLFAQLELPKYDVDDTIIRHRGYTLSYNSKYKQANWVAYVLIRPSTSLRTRFQREKFFAPAPLIPGTDFSIDYQKSLTLI
jgi:DNA/RNA endonuclease G (NUC1)